MKQRKFGRIFWSLLVAGAWLAGMGVQGASVDLGLRNLGFEEGEANWAAWGEGDLRSEYYGLAPASGVQFLRLWNRSGWYQDFAASGGQLYHVTARVATAGSDVLWGDAYGEVKVEWRRRSEDGTEEMEGLPISLRFSFDKVLGRLEIPKDAWEWVVLPPVQAPPKATHGRIICGIYTLGDKQGGGCALFDEITVDPVR